MAAFHRDLAETRAHAVEVAKNHTTTAAPTPAREEPAPAEDSPIQAA